ncbi:cytochrome P450 2J2-like [Oratosquilla oratoria]|uniref:cytochrome P450 2J2-like n=1 Tax=Oratosquilla oratoria TaxID=337810 RepID=UPI003F768004
MTGTMPLFELLVLFVCGLICFFFFRRSRNFPPGPMFPFLDQFGVNSKLPQHLRFHNWILQYGPVIGLRSLDINVIVLGDYNVIKEAFRRYELSYRTDHFFTRYGSKDSSGQIPNQVKGVLFSSGQIWLDNRRLLLRSFRDIGFGKSKAEVIIQKEAEHMINQMSRSHGRKQLMDGSQFYIHIVNTIWYFLTSKMYDHNDEDLPRLAQLVRQTLHAELGRSIWSRFPFILKTFPKATGFDAYSRTVDTIKSVIRKEIESHKKDFDEANAKDLINTYLIALSRANAPDTFSEEQLAVTGMDFFVAGSDTTTMTLRWAILYMALYPDVQENVFLELWNNLEGARVPSMEDRMKVPYTDAVISEIHRMGTVVPLGVGHMAAADTEILEYNIPKGSIVFGSIYSVHHDPAYWKDPHVFRPERFLSEDKSTYVHNERLLPFGTGRRVCLGESLARMEIFLFFTALVMRLRFSLPQDEPRPSGERCSGITCAPKPFHVVVYDRELE